MKVGPRLRVLLNWRTWVSILACIVVALVLTVVVDNARAAHDALAARDATERTANARIGTLNDEVRDLTSLVKGESEQIGTLEGEVTALQGQVHQLGGTPVVPPGSTTTTTSPSRPSQPPTTTTTTPPPKQPPPSSHCVLGICVTK